MCRTVFDKLISATTKIIALINTTTTKETFFGALTKAIIDIRNGLNGVFDSRFAAIPCI